MKIPYRLSLSLLLGLLPWGGVFAAPSIEIDAPLNGWRNGQDSGENFRQEINYPASSVNTPQDQSTSALILGRIKDLAKPEGKSLPARLVINGLAMPMRIEDDGSFSRPYSFPSGSNSVEVISPDGQQRKRVQFLHAGGGSVPAKLRILLSWDSDNTDLDLHLVTPDGGHVYYGNTSLPNGMAQDVDVTTGYGPEIMASPSPLKGTYLVYVNYYGGSGDQDAQPLTTAQVTIISEEGTVNEKQESFLIPMREAGELTLVKRFSYP